MVKPKRKLTEKQLEALKAGREKKNSQKSNITKEYKDAVKLERILKEKEKIQKIEEVKTKLAEVESREKPSKKKTKKVVESSSEEDESSSSSEEEKPKNYKRVIKKVAEDSLKEKLQNERYKVATQKLDRESSIQRALYSLGYIK